MVSLRFRRLTLDFEALDGIRFAEGLAANSMRAGLGPALRSVACLPECSDEKVCPIRQECAYSRCFGLNTAVGKPSGFRENPRPLVLRARHLDGRYFAPGTRFSVGVHLFDVRPETVAAFIRAFRVVGRSGLGIGRGRAHLLTTVAFAQHLGSDSVIRLEPSTPANGLAVRFLTPTELKESGQITARPDFPTLFARIRDRVSSLCSCYGDGLLPLDFGGMTERSTKVRMIRCDLERVSVTRHSGRTGQTHPLGGFVGEAEYEGPLTEFLPFLEAAQITGVGRQTIWGKGEIATTLR